MLVLTPSPAGALSARCSFLPSRTPSTALTACSKRRFITPKSGKNPNPLTANADKDSATPNKAISSSANPAFDRDETVFVEEQDVPLEGVLQFEKPRSKLNSWGQVVFLAGGDVLFLLVFSAIGRLSHGFPVFDPETLHTADPFVAGWLLGAYFLGGYGPDGRGMNGLTKAVFAATKSWAVGIPLGLAIRATTSGHIPAAPFVLVSMGSTAILLIGWRALLHALLPQNQTSRNEDVYRRGSPFELFELLTSLVRRW